MNHRVSRLLIIMRKKSLSGSSIISLNWQTANKENDNNEALKLPEESLINLSITAATTTALCLMLLS